MKLQVLVGEDLVARIDKLADYIGTSRSSLCATIIGKALPEWESCYYTNNVPNDANEEYEQIKIQE